jgi:hypothetical protein
MGNEQWLMEVMSYCLRFMRLFDCTPRAHRLCRLPYSEAGGQVGAPVALESVLKIIFSPHKARRVRSLLENANRAVTGFICQFSLSRVMAQGE